MKVKDIMTHSVCCLSPEMTIENASKLMRGADIGAVPVCGDDGLLGILTDRDIVTRAVAGGRGVETKVAEVMTQHVCCVSPDANVHDAALLMSEHQVRRLPVVKDGAIVGILTVGDMARAGRCDAEFAVAEKGIVADR